MREKNIIRYFVVHRKKVLMLIGVSKKISKRKWY